MHSSACSRGVEVYTRTDAPGPGPVRPAVCTFAPPAREEAEADHRFLRRLWDEKKESGAVRLEAVALNAPTTSSTTCAEATQLPIVGERP